MKKIWLIFPLILLLVTLFAGFLRVYKLSSYPVGFHQDEASLGYTGYSLLKTGRDEYGNRFPLYINMFGDYRPSGYHYLTIIPIALFGLNEFATRLPGALFGTISVIALYYLVIALFKDKKIALLSAFLLAISPWHIVSSRASAESIVSLFFILAGMAFVVESLNNKKILYLFSGSVLMTLSLFFYHTSRVFLPILLFSVMVLMWNKRKNYTCSFQRSAMLIYLGVVFVALLLVFGIKGGTGRFSQVTIFGSLSSRLTVEEQIREDGVRMIPPLIARIFHNKLVNYTFTFASNYFDYFTGQFLFTSGGRPLWYKVPDMGLLYIVELPFIIFGFIYLFIQNDVIKKIPILWLFLGPIVAAITLDDIPNVQRAMVMFPMFEILAGYGCIKLLLTLKSNSQKILLILTGLLLSLNIVYFMFQYFIQSTVHQTWYRNNGFKEMVLTIKKVYSQYDKFIITKTVGGLYTHILFFMKYDPATYVKEGSPQTPDNGGFGKFIFAPGICPSNNSSNDTQKYGKVLYVDSGVCEVKGEKILREDGTTAFIIVQP